MTATDPPATGVRPARLAGFLGTATVGSHVAQIIWLGLGSRVMEPADFGAVLAAQALYAVVQNPLDVGTSFLGGRRAARGELDDSVRGSLVRTRLGVGAMGILVVLAAMAAGGEDALQAMGPFVAALPLFALLNVWERYGTGDAAPWATYIFLRAANPAMAAAVCFAVGADFPLPLAGAAECAAILIVMLAFGLQPIRHARLAYRSRLGDLRAVVNIGLPSVLSQASLSAGTILLSLSGANVAAATFGVGLRLLTGLNNLLGVLSSALFPRLAARFGESEADAASVGVVLRLVTVVSGAALACVVLGAEPLSRLLLSRSGEATETTLVLIIAGLGASGGSVALTLCLIARQSERSVLRPYTFGAAVVLGGGACTLITHDGNPIAMAVPFIAGLLVTLYWLWRNLGLTFPELSVAGRMALLDATALAAAGAVAASTTGFIQHLAAVAAAALALARSRQPAVVVSRLMSALRR